MGSEGSEFKLVMTNSLKTAINQSHSSKLSRNAIETLLTIHKNILYNKDEVKYRQIRTENPKFYNSIWSLNHFRNFMLICGWIQVDDTLMFNSDENLINIIDALVLHRDIKPSETEWVRETKHEGMSEQQLKELKLRQEAEADRYKELQKFYRDKKYREELAAQIKADIKADRERRKAWS